MLENVRLSFQGIWSHKMRSFLTMLGIIIGIASIISIVSTIKGTNEQIKQNLIGAGNNNVTVSLKQGDGDYWMDNGLPSGVSKLSGDQKADPRAGSGGKCIVLHRKNVCERHRKRKHNTGQCEGAWSG